MEELKKIRPDKALAQGLLQASRERRRILEQLPLEIRHSTPMYCMLYDAIRELLDAILALDGWKSYSHVKSIEHLEKHDVERSIMNKLDVARQKRNNAQYYGRSISEADAQTFIALAEEIAPLLEGIILGANEN